jgi:hypothetical protein
MKPQLVPTIAESFADLIQWAQATAERWGSDSRRGGYSDNWFRGEANVAYDLIPGTHRLAGGIRARLDYELDLRSDFDLKSFPYLAGMNGGEKWSRYALMQHYGLPTRLLDWSDGLAVATWFAVCAAKPTGSASDTDASVWMLDPQILNHEAHRRFGAYIADPGDSIAKGYLCSVDKPRDPAHLAPLAMRIPLNSPRITSQRGYFTVCGRSGTPINRWAAMQGSSAANRMLARATIPARRLFEVKRQLRIIGITGATLFPEMASLCSEIRHDIIDDALYLDALRAKNGGDRRSQGRAKPGQR